MQNHDSLPISIQKINTKNQYKKSIQKKNKKLILST